jgi:SAM-dependent methyltransferase
MKCRFCGNQLSHVFVDLGSAPPSNAFLQKQDLDKAELYFPLKVFVCENCFLVQIDEYKKSTEIFDFDYVYLSSTSEMWIDHTRRYVEMIVARLGLNKMSRVIEIGSNDGYLLQFVGEKGIPCLGIEPAGAAAEIARRKGIRVIEKFFGTSVSRELARDGETADLVIGNNVLAHVPDINDFVQGLKTILKPHGSITLEFPHLMRLIDNNQLDTIYHEHFSYLSLGTVTTIFSKHGLEVYDVEEIPTHGGSIRIYARHAGIGAGAACPTVDALLSGERAKGMESIGYYLEFKNRVLKTKIDFLKFLITSCENGKRVAAYGAAAKGNTLLNFCGVKSDLIDFVVDAAQSKQGRYLPGSHIPVVAEGRLREEKPDYIVIFPWNIKSEILAQLSYVREWGAKFVVAVPCLSIL